MGTIIWRVALCLIAGSLAGCLPTAPSPTPPAPMVVPTAVPAGTWTQPGVANMTVGPDGVYLEFACGDPSRGASLHLFQTLALDSAGHFTAETTRLDLPERNGGMATPTLTRDETPVPPPYARLTGTTDGHTLLLTVEIGIPSISGIPGSAPSIYSYGPYTLTLIPGDASPLTRCTPQS